MWIENTTIYQIYPLGFCDAPLPNDNQVASRILKVMDWLPHFNKLGVGALLFNPIFESDNHGYDTRDFQKLDGRLGSNEDFAQLCQNLHQQGIRIILDAVFNHVGRGFWAFQDVLAHQEQSAYRDWFHINFHGDNDFGDGFWYEGWEGHFELVKLNLQNPKVVAHLLESLRFWMDHFAIDGLRLDVAYSLAPDFLTQLRSFCNQQKKDFLLIGEVIHGDYNQFISPQKLDSCTNYECYKGIYSSLNSYNMFEIAYSYNRQFGDHGIYQHLPLLSFVDNHDVTRIASILDNPQHLTHAQVLLMMMPGIPCLYYGSEWGTSGRKGSGPQSDWALRPSFEAPLWNALTDAFVVLIQLRKQHPWLTKGDYQQLALTNRQLLFSRSHQGEQLFIALNIDKSAFTIQHHALLGRFSIVFSHQLEQSETEMTLSSSLSLPPYAAIILQPLH